MLGKAGKFGLVFRGTDKLRPIPFHNSILTETHVMLNEWLSKCPVTSGQLMLKTF